jgi:mono/diheme cytochrome c family protein
MLRRRFVLAALLWAATAGCSNEVASGRADGAAIFSEVCARCHGPDGVPDPANVARIGVKPLNSPHVQGQLTDDEIRQQILRGSRNKQMPAFAGALSDAQVKAIIAHVRTLARPGQPSPVGQQPDRAQ